MGYFAARNARDGDPGEKAKQSLCLHPDGVCGILVLCLCFADSSLGLEQSQAQATWDESLPEFVSYDVGRLGLFRDISGSLLEPLI